jgi:hypothetical protein
LHNNNKFKDIKDLSKSALEFSPLVSVLKVGYTDILKGFLAKAGLLNEYYVCWALPIV